jgi:hypothetical protein
MAISYSSFLNHIKLFETEEYFKNLENDNSIDYFLDFLKHYKEIESEDLKKPLFSLTTKFKKIPNQYKNYKNFKSLKDKEPKTWNFENPVEENNKIIVLINTYLNKISEETYKNISNEFIDELLKLDNPNLFKLLAEEIFKKCIFDVKYRSLYLYICQKIWCNRQLHYNMVNITEKDNMLYWSLKSESSKISSMFSNENLIKNDIYNKLNFKKYFINYLQQLYNKKNYSFENLNEEEEFIKKKKILLLVELIGLLYVEKYIYFDIINIIIIDLLHINNFDKIEDIEYEALYCLLKVVKEHKKNYNSLVDYKIIFEEFTQIIKNLLKNGELTKRTHFFLEEIIVMFDLFIQNKSNIDNSSNNNINNKDTNDFKEIKHNKDIKHYKTLFIERLNNISLNNIDELVSIYNKLNDQYKYDVLYKSVEIFIGQRKTDDNIIKFLIKINDVNNIYTIIEKIINNIEDIMLDIPNANSKLIYLIEYSSYIHTKKNEYIQYLNSLEDSDSEDDD